MARCAMRRPLFRIPFIKPTPSSHPKDLVRARTALPARHDKIRACSLLRAPKHPNNSLAINLVVVCPNRLLAKDKTLHILISSPMARQMQRRLRSWRTICDQAAFHKELRPRRRIPSPPAPSNSRHSHRRRHRSMEHRNRIISWRKMCKTCRPCHRASTQETSRHPHHLFGRPRHPIPWAA